MTRATTAGLRWVSRPPNRWLSSLVLQALYRLVGSDAQRMMMAADFFLPFFATLAACYLVRPLCRRVSGMAAAALLVLMAAECLALRSTLTPFSGLHGWLQSHLQDTAGGPGGLFQMENRTATFWLFRTPEPQFTWILMFLAMGLMLRMVLAGSARALTVTGYMAAVVLLSLGYLFCALPLGCAGLLFAALAWRGSRGIALWIGLGGFLCLGTCLGVSLLAAREPDGESLVFRSHAPVLMLSVVAGLVAAGITGVRCWRRSGLHPVHLLALSLGLTPLCMANQQILTGRMIYLYNFENYGFAQLAALALLLALSANPVIWPEPELPTRGWPWLAPA